MKTKTCGHGADDGKPCNVCLAHHKEYWDKLLRALEDNKKLKAFAFDMLDSGDHDGGDIEESAIKNGLMFERKVTKEDFMESSDFYDRAMEFGLELGDLINEFTEILKSND